jgi:hypothetical protein
MTGSSTAREPQKRSKSKRRARSEQVAQLRKAQRRRDRRTSWLIWGSTAVVLILVATLTAFAIYREQANTSLEGVSTYPAEQEHVTGPVTYEQTPPAGGPHAPTWLNCNVYEAEVPNENAVHSMEHGAVWITYQPDLPPQEIAVLQEGLGQPYEILSPFEDLPAPVVASAWGKQLLLDGVDDPKLRSFISEYKQGPQTPEAGAACTGGTDGVSPESGATMTPEG